MALWIKLCRNSNVIFDVGANTGLYSLVAKAVNPQSVVHSFEPVNRVFNRLVENCQMNDFDIRAVEAALSNFDGDATIHDTGDEHILSVTVNKNIHPPGTSSSPVRVKVKTIQSYAEVRQIEKIDLMKIDVETHEAEVLEGMGKLLAYGKPTLLIEILNDEVGSKIESIINGLGYLFLDIDENTGVYKVDHITKSRYYNYLCCSEPIAKRLGLI